MSIEPIATGVIIGSKTAFVRTEIIFFGVWRPSSSSSSSTDLIASAPKRSSRNVENTNTRTVSSLARRRSAHTTTLLVSAARGATGETTLFTLEARREFFDDSLSLAGYPISNTTAYVKVFSFLEGDVFSKRRSRRTS